MMIEVKYRVEKIQGEGFERTREMWCLVRSVMAGNSVADHPVAEFRVESDAMTFKAYLENMTEKV